MLWFQEVNYLSVFLLKFKIRLLLLVVVTGVSAAYLWGNLTLAQQLKGKHVSQAASQETNLKGEPDAFLSPYSIKLQRSRSPLPLTRALRLPLLLPLVLGLALVAGILLLSYSQLAVRYWQTGPVLSSSVVSHFNLKMIGQFGASWMKQFWWLGGALGLVIALVIQPRFWLRAIALTFSLLFGWLISKQWAILLQCLHPTLFHQTDPLFGRDIAFYIFALPLWELLELWLFGLFLYGFIAVVLTYLLAGNSLSQGSFSGFSPAQQRHLYGVGSGLMAAIALSYWLGRYELVYSPRGVSFGASYTDVAAQLPFYTGLCLAALAIAGYLLWQTIFWHPTVWHPKSPHPVWIKSGLAVFGGLVVASLAVPEAMQYLVVQPNELARERPFIERTIAYTRQAFGLEVIDAKSFNPQGRLTEADLTANALTIRNIRLWDQRPLLETNRQLQQIRPYYRFPDADVDRYALQTDVLDRSPQAIDAFDAGSKNLNRTTSSPDRRSGIGLQCCTPRSPNLGKPSFDLHPRLWLHAEPCQHSRSRWFA